MQTLSTRQARQQFSHLVDSVFYTHEPVRIQRNKQSKAWLISDSWMQRLLQYLIDHEPALADTLAIEWSEDIQSILAADDMAAQRGEVYPFASILEE
jgi:hypothetical protein